MLAAGGGNRTHNEPAHSIRHPWPEQLPIHVSDTPGADSRGDCVTPAKPILSEAAC